MCGITGIFHYGGQAKKPISRKVLLSMTNSMTHRGPDDSSILVLPSLGFGHRRLSILDLSKNGLQPMSDKKKEIWIVTNGEVYNFKEIRTQLEEKEYTFRSDSDTEVIIYAYKEWGIDCIKKFNGMFSLAIFDSRTNELFLVRDRLGIKPLYYTILEGTLLFSSEIKALLQYPSFNKELNLKAVSSYLSYRYELGKSTLFEGVFKILPGHYMHAKEGSLNFHEYWNISLSQSMVKSFSQCKKQVKKLLERSVKLRMISDVPVGAYLSGGLDSSIIVALMSKNTKKPVKTFSIGFEEEKYNEFSHAKKVADKYKTDHKEIMLPMKDYLKTMKQLIKFKDLPLSVPNEVPIYLLSKELKKDITVVLSGEGADEIFSGYGRIFRSPLDYQKLKMGKFLPSFLKKRLFKRLIKKYHGKKFENRMRHFLHNYSYFPLEEKKFIFNEKMTSTIHKDEHLNKIFAKYFEESKNRSYHDQISYVFEKAHLPGLLQRLDCPTMAASVEGRVPFVDHTLVEFMFRVPHKYKMKWKSLPDLFASFTESSDEISEVRDTTKYALREVFKHMLPEGTIIRKKKGFPVPLDVWFRGPFISLAKKELLNKRSKIRIIMNQTRLERWIDTNLKRDNDRSFGQKLWMILNLEYWLRAYFPNKKA